ncbi:anti-sigma regulatory factor (Ser/Thr protein kinase) [Caldicoprobacter guelmensis]|uniref:ATP-binding protein n=1 Tax=Caldicoprobacter guelmensis TaxID=1170224 RepID=UPI00195D47AA|nr:ATP-binding protein [Caldicoprobacter guelmensis]MBM7581936.1 anti-sigma regulatory factor (Ser/Thr protein kinase) [Caldicoprobacter guelmensis]
MGGNNRSIEQVFYIKAGDFASAGEASSQIKKTLKQLGVDSGVVRRATIAAYEAEMNLIIHSIGGELKLKVTPETIIITAEDKGPGIPDIDLAMQEGYSTAPEIARELGFGAGMGLPNIKRNADRLNIQSKVGEGTLVEIYFDIKAR